ncbi:recombinase family protein, partial [Francisellaceae bacterium]|nr:recombinase family protein [Francisellaceae bacterium]
QFYSRAPTITFVSIKDSIDTSSPIGEFFFTVTSALAQLERETILLRTKDGIAAAKARGVKFGKPKGMTLKNSQKCAYMHDYITKLKPNEKQSISKLLKEQEISRASYYRYVKNLRDSQTEEQTDIFVQ